MRTETVTTILDSPRDEVFRYIADVENLPRWATEFARELRHDQDGYTVVNGLGEFAFEIHADATTGVVDMFAGPDRERMAVFPTRAVALPDGRTAFSFTMFQTADMPDELFESQYRSLCREFENIEREFGEGGAAVTSVGGR
jgi:hypothetical protein